MLKSIFAGLVLLGAVACANSSKGSRYSPEYHATADQRAMSVGTQIIATLRNEVSSANNASGEIVEAVVRYNVRDVNGVVAIPAGSTVFLNIASLEPAHASGNRDGALAFSGYEVSVGGMSYPISATTGAVEYGFVGRGTPIVDASMHGPNEGTEPPARYAERDVVAAPGTRVVLTLTERLNVWVK